MKVLRDQSKLLVEGSLSNKSLSEIIKQANKNAKAYDEKILNSDEIINLEISDNLELASKVELNFKLINHNITNYLSNISNLQMQKDSLLKVTQILDSFGNKATNNKIFDNVNKIKLLIQDLGSDIKFDEVRSSLNNIIRVFSDKIGTSAYSNHNEEIFNSNNKLLEVASNNTLNDVKGKITSLIENINLEISELSEKVTQLRDDLKSVLVNSKIRDIKPIDSLQEATDIINNIIIKAEAQSLLKAFQTYDKMNATVLSLIE